MTFIVQASRGEDITTTIRLSVVVAIALAIVFLHERVTGKDAIGAGLIVIGALVLALK